MKTDRRPTPAPGNSLPVLVEHLCERRGEHVAHVRRDDGTYLCVSADYCASACDAKPTDEKK